MVMVKKLLAFILHLIGPRTRQRIKEASTYDEVVGLDSQEKAKGCSAEVKLEGEGDECELCSICLSRYRKGMGQGARVLPCMHKFHKVCIDKWFNMCRKTCPVCRFSMGAEEKFQKREELTEEMVIWFSSFHVAGF